MPLGSIYLREKGYPCCKSLSTKRTHEIDHGNMAQLGITISERNVETRLWHIKDGTAFGQDTMQGRAGKTNITPQMGGLVDGIFDR